MGDNENEDEDDKKENENKDDSSKNSAGSDRYVFVPKDTKHYIRKSRSQLLSKLRYAIGQTVECKTGPEDDDNENENDRYVFAPEDTSDYIRKPRRKFHEYINCWIPIATYAVMECTENQLRLCNNNRYNAFNIIAIYGNQDKEGMVVSKRLEEYADAKIEKLNGRHPVYLDSPDEFVPTIGWAII